MLINKVVTLSASVITIDKELIVIHKQLLRKTTSIDLVFTSVSMLTMLITYVSEIAMLPYGFDSNVTKLLANLLTKPSVFYYLPLVSRNLVSIKLLLLLYLAI